MIKIITVGYTKNEAGNVLSRYCNVVISNEDIQFLLSVGNLPTEGDLQPVLDGREAELWATASQKGNDVPLHLTFKQEAQQFLVDNPAAKALLELNLADLEAAIENRTADQETLLFKTLAVGVRFLYEGLQ